jgi:hypothetical protein
MRHAIRRAVMNASRRAVFACTYLASYTTTTNSLTITFNNVALGDPPKEGEKRHILLVRGRVQSTWNTQPVSTSVTVNGEPANLLVSRETSSAAGCMEMWIIEVPNGTTASVVLTTTGNTANRHSLTVYKLDNLPVDPSRIGTASAGGTSTAALSVKAGDLVIAAGLNRSATAFTVSNIDNDYAASAGSQHYAVVGRRSIVNAGTHNMANSVTATALVAIAIPAAAQ